MSSAQTPQPPQMSVISQAYDRTGKGYLDETEKAMRKLDESGKGHLSNDAVYEILLESTKQTKRLATQRYLLIALGCFTIILALANMATAFAAASLAKDTTVTKTGELAVKGDEDKTVTTASKGKTFTLGPPVTGTAPGDAGRRKRRLQEWLVGLQNENGWNGHSEIPVEDAEARYYAYDQGFPTRVKWNCGSFDQERARDQQGPLARAQPATVVDVLCATVVPYTRNVTDDATNETITESGLLYRVEVGGGGGSNRVSGVRGESTVLFFDCAELSDQDILASNYFLNGFGATCTVTGTGCCGTWNDLETGERRDDCPEFRACNPCGCTCGEENLIYSLRGCDSGCGVDIE